MSQHYLALFFKHSLPRYMHKYFTTWASLGLHHPLI